MAISTTLNKNNKFNIMSNAWTIAKSSFAKYKVGTVKDYFKESLKQAWANFKANLKTFLKVTEYNMSCEKLYTDNSGQFKGAIINEFGLLTVADLAYDTAKDKLFGGAIRNMNAWANNDKFPSMTEIFRTSLEEVDNYVNRKIVWISEAQTNWIKKLMYNDIVCFKQITANTMVSYRLGQHADGFTQLIKEIQ